MKEGGSPPDGPEAKNSGSGMRQLCRFRTRKSGPGALRKNAANEHVGARKRAGVWSAERRSVLLARGRAAFPARGRGCCAPLGAPLPSLRLVRERRVKGAPGAFQTIRAMTHGCLIFESALSPFVPAQSGHPGAEGACVIQSTGSPLFAGTNGGRVSVRFMRLFPSGAFAWLPGSSPGTTKERATISPAQPGLPDTTSALQCPHRAFRHPPLEG
jgi:hypothetical protein